MRPAFGASLVLAALCLAPACDDKKSDDSSEQEDGEKKEKKKKKKEKKDEAVLPRIEKYEPPKNEEIADIYDSKSQKLPVEVLVWDVFQRLKMDVKLTELDPKSVKVDDVKKGIAVYMERDWKKIAGYRPHGNWNFIRTLTDPERERLAQEILDHAQKNGLFMDL